MSTASPPNYASARQGTLAGGFRRYGFNEAARRVCSGILHAARHFEHERLPELFAGFTRAEYGVPVRYPVACHPQAWAAASVPYLLETFLGLEPAAFDQRLRIVRPCLPDFVDRVEVRRLRIGKARVDLAFHRAADDCVSVQVLKVEGALQVDVDESRTK